MTQKKKTAEESRLLRVWEEWPAEWLDPFRNSKQIEEARRRRIEEAKRRRNPAKTVENP